jgi:hypothetical protein
MTEARQPIHQRCKDCARVFTISPHEMERIEELAARRDFIAYPPRKCMDCRATARRERAAVVIDDGQDEHLWCRDCGCSFLFEEHEKRYFAEHGLQRPKSCKACREARRGQRHSPRPGDRAGEMELQ